MFPSSIAVKKTALAALKGEWPTAIAAVFIPFVFFLITVNLFSLIEYIFSAPVWVATASAVLIIVIIAFGLPLCFGSLRVLWSIGNEHPLSLSEVFYYISSLKNYKRAVTFIVLFLGNLVLKAVALLLPSFIIDLISNSSSTLFKGGVMPLWVDNLWIFAVFLRIIAAGVIIYIAARYYLAPFLFIADDNADPFGILQNARSVSRVSMGGFVTLVLSLAGWILLSVFIAPILFTCPYINMCYLIHSRFAVVFYNNRKEKYDRGVAL